VELLLEHGGDPSMIYIVKWYKVAESITMLLY